MTKINSLKKYQHNQLIEELVRVDHAGEYGAKLIYQGQLSVLKNHKDIKGMLEQELTHLEYFEKEIKKRKVRPTVLQPLWHVGGFAMGAITALMGEKAAMACTVAVEEVIDAHYQEQLKELNKISGEDELKSSINKFREEEVDHMNHGLDAGAQDALGYPALKFAVSTITKVAIALSKKF
ncbi:MAG: demethoxyubiquinone hydroxylase family protein [Alphaproteobacteria bacterium]|jgi:ubiquinone biosynthesis monooxygenase Coq7|nr:demethoxyubiquinone hydroxylase family protein [Candidatus Jidaibacter sp.]